MSITQGQNYTADGVTLQLVSGQFSVKSLAGLPNSVAVKRLTSDTPGINGTTSTGLTVALLANTNYVFKYFILYDDTNRTITNYQIHALAAGASLIWVSGRAPSTIANNPDKTKTVAAVTTNILSSIISTGPPDLAEFEGLITVGANATTLQLDGVATNTTDKIAKAGSWVEVATVT